MSAAAAADNLDMASLEARNTAAVVVGLGRIAAGFEHTVVGLVGTGVLVGRRLAAEPCWVEAER